MLGALERRPAWRAPAILVAGAGFSVVAGLAAGHPSPETRGLVAAVVLMGAFGLALRFPFAGLLALVASSMLLVVIAVTETRGLNPFDLLMPAVLAGTFARGAHRLAVAKDRAGDDTAPSISRAFDRMKRTGLLFYGLAILSLVPWVLTGRAAQALDSFMVMVRGFQALALLPLCIWWLRTPKRLDRTVQAIMAGGLALLVTNVIAILFWETRRAGMTWVLNADYIPMNGPNEAGMSTLVLGAIVLATRASRPRIVTLLFLGVALATLVLTQSRSSLLAWAVFALLSMRRSGWKGLLALAAALAVTVPLVPDNYWERLGRTIFLEKGTFEAFSSLVRIYGWKVAWGVFLENPIFGVGYLGFRFISDAYNEFRMVFVTAENFYLEIAVSMGIVGLTVLGILIARLFQLGRAVHRASEEGSIGHAMGRYHGPLLAGVLVANLTGDNLVGLAGLAHLSLWLGILVQAGRLSARESSR